MKISIRKVTELEVIGKDLVPSKNQDQYVLLKIEAGKRMRVEEEGEDPYDLQLAEVHDQLAWTISPAVREVIREVQQMEEAGVKMFKIFPVNT